MSLKIVDAWRLSFANIWQHKKRSIITVLTISVLFGFVMGLNFLINGLETTLFEASAQGSGGRAYIEVWYDGAGQEDSGGLIITPEEIDSLDLMPYMPEEQEQKIREQAERYHGEMVGSTWYYQLDYPFYVTTLSAVENLVTEDLSKVPEGKIPVLVKRGGFALSGWSRKSLSEQIDKTFYEVGTLPTPESGRVDLPGFNILNPILSMVAGSNAEFFLVDDGSGRVEEYIREQMKIMLADEEGSHFVSRRQIAKQPVVAFENYEDLTGFMAEFAVWPYGTGDFYSNTTAIVRSFATTRALLKMLEVIILIIAVIVATLTFAHLIDQDANTVALYRAMGASTGDIYWIYFLYLVELCVMAVVMCFVMALAMAGLVVATSSGALARSLQEYYHLASAPEVRLFSIDKDFWLVIVAIMLVAPLALAFTLRRFSARHVAKKMREE